MLKKVYESPRDYSAATLREIEYKMIINKRLFVLLNSLSIIIVAIGAIMTTLVLSKQVPFFLDGNNTPNWYFFLTTGISACTTLISGMLNFFVIREKVKNYSQKREDLLYEIIAYNNKTSEKYRVENRDYIYYKSIAAIVGSQALRKAKGE